jgi:NAD(P)H-nitrite reductase large subunit
MAKVVPEYLAKWTTNRVQEEGVTTVSGSRVSAVSETKLKPGNPTNRAPITLHLDTGARLEVDEVVVAVGISPNIDLAQKARLEIDASQGGILVNSELEARSDVYAAGTVRVLAMDSVTILMTSQHNASCGCGARFGKSLHTKMSLVPTPARLKCSVEAGLSVTKVILLGLSLLPVDTVNSVQTLKVMLLPSSMPCATNHELCHPLDDATQH